MNLRPTEEQEAIVAALHDLAETEIRPAARECEFAGQVTDRIQKQLFEMGVSVPIPLELGGQGTFDSLTSVMIAEEIAWGDPGVAFATLGSGLPATIIDIAGSAEQKEELLPRMLEGSKGFLAIAERDAGADLSLLETKVSGEPERINGLKYGVLDADEAAVRLVVCSGQGGNGIWRLDGKIETKQEDKLGLRSAKTFKVRLEDVEAHRIGSGDADASVAKALMRAKLLNAGVSLGLARAALEYATRYAKERTAFGRPIGAFQAISFKIADRAMDLDSARLLTWKAAWAVDNEHPEAHRFVMAACGHAVAAAAANADDGVQILGGHGYMQDHPEEMWYRDAMTLAALDSPSMVGDLFLAQEFKVAIP